MRAYELAVLLIMEALSSDAPARFINVLRFIPVPPWQRLNKSVRHDFEKSSFAPAKGDCPILFDGWELKITDGNAYNSGNTSPLVRKPAPIALSLAGLDSRSCAPKEILPTCWRA